MYIADDRGWLRGAGRGFSISLGGVVVGPGLIATHFGLGEKADTGDTDGAATHQMDDFDGGTQLNNLLTA